MKRFLRSRWVWIALFVTLMPVLGWLLIRSATVNEMYPALDKLASIRLGDRWSKPEMMAIRQLGAAAVPPLRRVLREKDTRTTHFLLWVKTNWPSVARHYTNLPDANKLTERRQTACQVLATLGPAAKPAVPELIDVMASKDVRDVNSAATALWAAGPDAQACDRIDAWLEKGVTEFSQAAMINVLEMVKPPSPRTLKVLTKELTDPSPYTPQYAASALGRLGVSDPAVIEGLKKLQRLTTDDLTVITCSVALWQLQKDDGIAASNIINVLERLLQDPIVPPFGGGSGGQGVGATEQAFIKGAEALEQMRLTENEKARALGILQSYCDKSGRIFIRMLLLSAMMDLGLPGDKCLDVCMTGLSQSEDYYRLQAAQLLVAVAGKFPTKEVDVDSLIQDKELGVRVYAAKIHWQNHKNPEAVVPVLAGALDMKKYQSYYYPEIVRAALGELGEIGSEAQAARTNVAALTKDPDPRIAQLATETLNKLGK